METEKDAKSWSDDFIPFPHLPGCTFNETVFQRDLQEMLYTPRKLLSRLMLDNQSRIAAGKMYGKNKVAPLHKHPEVIAGSDFVMSYLTDQRHLLSVERTKFYDLCECRVPLVDKWLSSSDSDKNQAKAWTPPQSSPWLSQSSSESDLQKTSTDGLLQKVEKEENAERLENCQKSLELEDLYLALFLDQSEEAEIEHSGAVQSQIKSPTPAAIKRPVKELEFPAALSYLKAYGSPSSRDNSDDDIFGEISDSD